MSNKKPSSIRPSKKRSLNMRHVEILSKKGFTDQEMADFFEVSLSSWYDWKKKDIVFKENISTWKSVADNNVQRSLYERATGYETIEQKAFQDKKSGTIEIVSLTKQHPPDPTSMIFWLKNRQPDKFRDVIKNEHDVTGTLAEALKEARDRRKSFEPKETPKLKDITPVVPLVAELTGEEDFLE